MFQLEGWVCWLQSSRMNPLKYFSFWLVRKGNGSGFEEEKRNKTRDRKIPPFNKRQLCLSCGYHKRKRALKFKCLYFSNFTCSPKASFIIFSKYYFVNSIFWRSFLNSFVNLSIFWYISFWLFLTILNIYIITSLNLFPWSNSRI